MDKCRDRRVLALLGTFVAEGFPSSVREPVAPPQTAADRAAKDRALALRLVEKVTAEVTQLAWARASWGRC